MSITLWRKETQTTWYSILWRQFGAAIDMLENTLKACPEALWQDRLYPVRSIQPEFAEFWYILYHSLFWLDFYLSDSVEGFAPPAPFTLSEFEADLLPDRVYTKAELQSYLEYCRNKCHDKLTTRTDALVPQKVRLDWPEMSVAELHLYNMRHVQEHAAQLSLYLGQKADWQASWVGKARSKKGTEENKA